MATVHPISTAAGSWAPARIAASKCVTGRTTGQTMGDPLSRLLSPCQSVANVLVRWCQPSLPRIYGAWWTEALCRRLIRDKAVPILDVSRQGREIGRIDSGAVWWRNWKLCWNSSESLCINSYHHHTSSHLTPCPYPQAPAAQHSSQQ